MKNVIQKFGLAGFAFSLLKGLVWLGIGGATLLGLTSKNDSPMQLKVSVYDTYVPKKNGGVMHFDILVDSNEKGLGQNSRLRQGIPENKGGGRAAAHVEAMPFLPCRKRQRRDGGFHHGERLFHHRDGRVQLIFLIEIIRIANFTGR